MNLKFATTLFLSIFISNLSAQNCTQINSANMWEINDIINTLSASGGGCIEITPGDYYLNQLIVGNGNGSNQFIIPKDNVVIKNYGKLYSKWIIFYLNGVKNISIIGDKIGYLAEDTNFPTNLGNKGILIIDSDNINITGLNINSFKNKGIEVVNSTNVTIRDNKITGSDSSSGAGIAITDALFGGTNYKGGSSLSNISSNFISNSRIGITLNRSFEVVVNSNIVVDNIIAGIALDGSVDGSNDIGTGSQNCVISNNIVKNNANSDRKGCFTDPNTNEPSNDFRQDYAGIYIGNGAQKNIITNNFVRNNYYGISYFEEENFTSTQTSYNNIISNNQVILNKWVGIKLTRTNNAIVTENQIVNNKLAGIQIHDTNILNYTIRNNNVILNGKYGFLCTGCDNANKATLNYFNVLTGHTTKDIELLSEEYQNSVLCD
ncbi:right-handed parallel beta-helix repeat-containing protein [Flavivirga eckloniae]|uniref:Right handed beta helix domain-containing protein n=1 Tax=Flavivirga eckloniae TaxID=1803846 RepID=A0A2K9PU19_9FLAO|nr:right-handed parallel beta-helix repeat-containing protein [Flavivirga eckloniae]AUP80556.1 hypothetical protein C1H87_18290 [Flavivirga eckloniae]